MPKPDPKPATDKLEAAYALKTPADNVSFYRDFATTYDEGFVVDTGYVIPREVARVFLEQTTQNVLRDGIQFYLDVIRRRELVQLAAGNESTIQLQLNPST